MVVAESQQQKEGEKVQTKHINQLASMPSSQSRPADATSHRYPEKEWFAEWKKTLNLPNIKACVSHTYNKAMHIRNQMIELDPSLSSL